MPPQTRDASTPPRFALDGELTDGEYWGAAELPYSDERHHDASGKLYVAVESPSAAHAATTLHLFAQHIRADQESRELRLYLDLQRLDRAPAGLDDDDRMIALSLRGDVEVRAVNWFGATSNWYAVDDPNFDAHIGTCAPDASAGGAIYCDAEFQLELTTDQIYSVPPPDPGPAPMLGMAFAMYSVHARDFSNPNHVGEAVPYFSGALPETFVNHLADDTDRTQQMSLEFADPHGVPIKFLSWNLAHWGTEFEWAINDTPFKHVDLGDLAEIMKDYDVVAVQEMWSTKDARTLLDEINARRPADEQMTLAGPVDFPAHVLSSLGLFLLGSPEAASLRAIANTQGGVFIYSRFPVVQSNHIVYDDCRGEDCIKAKGALHVRLALRPPGSGSEARPECSKQGGAEPGLGCEADPTGEMYVDVYDTHLQAGGSDVCGALDTWWGKLAQVAFFWLRPGAVPIDQNLNCGVDPVAVQKSQYRQLADFVARTSTDPNRTILAGDFNTNGRRIGEPAEGDDAAVRNHDKYETLLHTLGVYEASATWPAGPAHIDGAQDDLINRHPDVFPWDINHGDIAREEDATYDWLRCGVGTQAGTANDTECRRMLPGAMGVPSRSDGECVSGHDECEHHSCDLWDDGRLDYIFVGAFPAAVSHGDPIGDPSSPLPRPSHPSYLLGRGPGEDPLWERLQPIPVGEEWTCGRDPGIVPTLLRDNLTLLSDHAPIAGNLMLFPMRQPGVYHPAWDHALEVRVTSADVTGTADCIAGICGETELYFKINRVRTSVSGDDGSVWPETTPFTTNYCHGWTLPNEDADCMAGWAVRRPVIAGDALTDEITFKMREDDSFHDDHYSITDPESDPRFFFRWDLSRIEVKNQDDHPLTRWPDPITIRNTDPIFFGMHRADQSVPFAGFVVNIYENDLIRPYPLTTP